MSNLRLVQDVNESGVTSERTETPRRGVSERYRAVETNDLLDSLAVFGELDLAGRKIRQGYGTTTITEVPIIGDFNIAGDVIAPRLTLVNSMKGEAALNVMLGFHRMICTNGMTAGTSVFNCRVEHRKGPKIEEFLEQFQDNVAASLSILQPALADLSNLTDRKIDFPMLVLRELLESKLMTQAATRHVVNQYKGYSSMREADKVHAYNVWGIWNLCNEALRITATKRSSDASQFDRNRRLLPAILKEVA
jgi:hypothetical protein